MRPLAGRWARAAGSGHFFTRWSWLLTLPFAVTLLGGYDEARSGQERLAGFGIALAVHLVLGAFGVLAAAAERGVASAGSRRVVVVIALAAIAVGRPFLLSASAQALGLVLFTGPLAARVATNLIVDTAALSLVAMMTIAVRTHRDVTGRLRLVLDALEVQRAHDVDDVAVLSGHVLENARGTLLAALPRAAAGPLEPERAGLLLQRFAEEVVRPLSHRLFDDHPAAGDHHPATAAGARYPAAGGDGRLLASRESRTPPRAQTSTPLALAPVHPFPAPIDRGAPVWITVVAYALLWVPYLVAHASAAAAATAVLAVVAVGACGNRLVAGRVARAASRATASRTAPGAAAPAAASAAARPAAALAPVAGLALQYAVVGAVIGAVAALSPALWGVPVAASAVLAAMLLSVVVYPVFAVLVAGVDAGFRRLVVVEAELAAAVDEAAVLAASSHNSATIARRRVAHLLHSEVQAECVAAARELRGSPVVTEAQWMAVLERIEAALALPRAEATGAGAQQTVERIVGAWRFGLEISLSADAAAWTRLDADAARLELAVDTIAEGLTNTIRHGSEPRARITLAAASPGPGVVVDVVSEGRIVTRAGHDGYGLAQLGGRARQLTLTQAGSAVRLRVELA